MPYILIAIAIFYFTGGCSEDKWDGFAYPDRNDLTRHIETGTFSTLEQCRVSTINKLESVGSNTSIGDYECGLNCKPYGGGLNVCEETLR